MRKNKNVKNKNDILVSMVYNYYFIIISQIYEEKNMLVFYV